MKNILKNFYKNNFVYSTKEKLSKLTVLFIAILNIIVFYVISEGISFQTNFVNSPYKQYSYNCGSVVSSNLSDFGSYSYRKNYNINSSDYYDDFRNSGEDLDERCKIIDSKLAKVREEHNIEKLVKAKDELQQKEFKVSDELYYLRNNYNTVLFEKMATQNVDKSLVEGNVTSENIKEKYDEKTKEYEELKQEQEKLYTEFSTSKSVQDLKSYIDSIKDEYSADETSAIKMYYYKIEIIKLLFLLPLVLIFFYLMKKYLKEEKYILYVIFKNILIVSLIPTLFTILIIIHKFLPKIFISKIIEFFYNLEIPFLLYYILITIFIFIFVLIIIKLQKRFKEQNELMKNNKISKIKFYNQSLCNSCGNKVDYLKMNYCPVCKNVLMIECEGCKNLTISGLNFCKNCGDVINK